MVKEAFKGIRVADFSWQLTGPIITRYLADMGAIVVRVESATITDITRMASPFKDNKPGLNRSGYFALYNCGKYGVSLNLRHPRGPEVARRLIDWSDIVVESFTPGTMARWGLDYESVSKRKPEIIYFSTTNQGQTGSFSRHPGYGFQLVALAGLVNITGWPDRDPSQPWMAYTDILSPPFGLAALISALLRKEQTGKGEYIDHSQLEASLQYLAALFLDYGVNGREPKRDGNSSSRASPHTMFPCKGDDRWCSISIYTSREWKSFTTAISSPSWAKEERFQTVTGRKKHEKELEELISTWTSQHTAEEVMDIMQRAGIASGVVKTGQDMREDPQLAYREHFTVLEHREIGKHSCEHFGFRFSENKAEMRFPSPCLGEYNEYVYKELLGYSEEEYVQLLLEGVLE